jgi:hypothetical protein
MGWRQGSIVSTLFLRNLEAKFLKTENLCGVVRETEPGEMPRRVCAQCITLNYMVAD